jgi:4-hydroxybenzoate polyprenyltransferase
MWRVDHWFKNVFVLPGVVVALGLTDEDDLGTVAVHVVVGLVAVCLVASSNYVLNELQDAATDVHHPVKRHRPVPAGLIDTRIAYAQWVGLMVVGVGLAFVVNWQVAATLFGLWLMGCIYNVPPLRTKDHPYVDVLSESVNNPIRMLAGWYMVTSAAVAPLSLLLSYWMIGCYLMAAKRFAEYRDFERAGGVADAVRYRKSFAHYTDERLLVSIMFYASTAMLFFGAFIVRYRLELILSFPLVAVFMSMYLHLAFRPDSPVEHPERLFRERALMVVTVLTVVLMTVLLFVDLPFLVDLFEPSV